ncbi:pregnancy zone protein-like [Pollicipes pollicipes]|uniref:pregnancy zone protein-like n=1 Tax=Pollicipes pollicipes TaxID=41117 RepID=UPI0018859153|nr:pregnancy zone protein-like [Pollicipes pollicipes]
MSIGDDNVCFDFTVPKKVPTYAFLRATVRSGLFWSTRQLKLRLLPYTLVTLVQTDKSKYKAGDLVQFRVVTLKNDLTVMEEVVDQIFITTPGGTRLAQFDKVATRSGIIQKKFQLTEEPPLGRWTIHVKRGDSIVRQPFEVEEYVLPRFEVTIAGPKYITRGANTVTLKVCATYTFGKPVSGAAMKLLVSRPSTFFYRRWGAPRFEKNLPSNVKFAEETDKNGCVEIDVVLAKIGLGSASTGRVHASRIMTRGQIIRQSYVDSWGLIRVPLGFDVSPVFKVLVYFVNSLGEIVSDSKAFKVANCFQNKVSVSWNKKRVKPGETATFTVRGAPNSLCGVCKYMIRSVSAAPVTAGSAGTYSCPSDCWVSRHLQLPQ